MDPTIKQTIDGMLSSFAYVQVTDEGVRAEIEQYKADMYALGQRAPDVGSFMTELTSSGLMEKQSDLMTRASMAAQQAPATDTGQPAVAPGALPSVSQFLEQYRPSYDAAKAHGFQYSTVKAYEQVFAVADRTDDLLTMNVILESEGLLRATTACALYDVNKLHFDATDPNNLGVRQMHTNLMQLAGSYRTDEELYFHTDQWVQHNQQGMYRHNFMIIIAAQLALVLIGYNIAKGKARMDLKKYSGDFIGTRDAIRATYATIGDLFGLDFDGLLANPWLKHWVLGPSTLDSTGRVTSCLDTRNLDYFREVLFEEALTDLTDLQCVEREFVHPFYPSLDTSHNPTQRQAEEQLQQVGKQRLSDKYYHGYETKVKVPGMDESA
jgi:hypothetical protein